MPDKLDMKSSREEALKASTDMTPVFGEVEVAIPAGVLWREFNRANYWPRWNKCFFWCKNKSLTKGESLIWSFEPIRKWMIYKFPAIAKIDVVAANDQESSVTWEVLALPGFYARHTYAIKDVGNGKSLFSSWEQAKGWNFRLFRFFWLPHFEFVKKRSLEGVKNLEAIYLRTGTLDVSTLKKRRYWVFWIISFLAIAAVAISAWFYTAYIKFNEVKLTPNTQLVLGGGSNSVIIDGQGKRLIIDPKFPPSSKKLKKSLNKKTDSPVTVLINTHYHYDHTQGNILYPGTDIYSHTNTPALMTARDGNWWHDGRKTSQPNLLISEYTETKFGNIKINLQPIEGAHTKGDLVVILPDDNIVILGDIFFHTYYPFFDVGDGGAVPQGIIDSLRQFAEQYPTARFIPGHGPVATAKDVTDYAQYLEDIQSAVDDAISDGVSIDDLLKTFESKKKLSVLPSFHNGKLIWATRTSNIRDVYTLTEKSAK